MLQFNQSRFDLSDVSQKSLRIFFCLEPQIRMRNCGPYNEVSKETLNPHHLLQQGTVQFNDEEYKS